jgi:hypothetical protein
MTVVVGVDVSAVWWYSDRSCCWCRCRAEHWTLKHLNPDQSRMRDVIYQASPYSHVISALLCFRFSVYQVGWDWIVYTSM